MDEATTKEELRPVKKQLVGLTFTCFIQRLTVLQKNLKLSGEDMPRDDKVAILKDSLAAIGKRIEFVLAQKEAAGEDRDRWRRHLWAYVTIFRSEFLYLNVVLALLLSFGQRRSRRPSWKRFTLRW